MVGWLVGSVGSTLLFSGLGFGFAGEWLCSLLRPAVFWSGCIGEMVAGSLMDASMIHEFLGQIEREG